MKLNASYNPCRCCQAPVCNPGALTRRGLLTGAAGASLFPAMRLGALAAESGRQAPVRTPLKVQPVLVYDVPKRVEARSWRNWGAVHTEQDAAQEQGRIQREIAALASPAVEFMPLAAIKTVNEAGKIAQGPQDLTLVYAAGGSVRTHEVLAPPSKWTIMFVRHRSGPVYLWYEIAHPRFLRKTVDEYGQPGMDEQDVVVDSQSELQWRLRSLAGLKNTLGQRIVALGGAGGWGAGGRKAAESSRNVFKLDIQTVSYADLGEMIKKARANEAVVKKAQADSEAYLKQKGTTLETKREFVTNSFILTEVFQQVLDQTQTDCMTINQCMSTIMPLSETTACLPLSLLNDKGYMAFCESDFVVIPAGILLHHISGRPVFLNDPTYPHDGVVTLAHCTAPRKMDADRVEPVRIVTHFESDYGAAPKVEMRKGQHVTTLDPDFNFKRWVAFEGEIAGAPFLPICRSQIDVAFKGSNDTLVKDMKGFHWMTCYGSYVRESGYALKRIGIELQIV
jgi:hypothetical protein